jgi:hypothetical protein
MTLVTALDADPGALDEHEHKFVALIREHGWFNTRVFDGDPAFSYTTGFLLQGSPEFVIFSMKSEIAHDVFWDLFRDAQKGVRRTTGIRHDDIFGNLPAYLFSIADRYQAEYLGWSRWFYGKEVVPTLQILWPDRAGIFPWEPGFDEEFRNDQPDLSEKGWVNELVD